ncbi:MAG: ECF-type sigma factor [Candidatus Eisenbacteria bacterium]
MPPGDTLQPTALIHETYLRLVAGSPQAWNGRGHFFGAAAQAMWRILVERAREKSRQKRGGGWQRVSWDGDFALDELTPEERVHDVLALDEALERLGKDTRRGRVVFLRFVAGLSVEEVAEMLGIGARTVERDWHFSRLFLMHELQGEPPAPGVLGAPGAQASGAQGAGAQGSDDPNVGPVFDSGDE